MSQEMLKRMKKGLKVSTHSYILSQYTGDFRFENIDLSTLNVMHDSEGHVLPVDEMYLDTTFCSPTYKHFPSREESLVAIWNIVTGWIKKNGKYRTQRPKHVVLFQLPGSRFSSLVEHNQFWIGMLHMFALKNYDCHPII